MPKPLPEFQNEDEEKEFWASHDSTDYVDWSRAGRIVFSFTNLTRLAQRLFLLNAAVWLLFGIISLVRLAQGGSTGPVTLWAVAILMFGNAGAMLLSALLIGKRKKATFLFASALLLANIFLTFTDQFGLFDLLTLLLDLVLLGILIAARSKAQRLGSS